MSYHEPLVKKVSQLRPNSDCSDDYAKGFQEALLRVIDEISSTLPAIIDYEIELLELKQSIKYTTLKHQMDIEEAFRSGWDYGYAAEINSESESQSLKLWLACREQKD